MSGTDLANRTPGQTKLLRLLTGDDRLIIWIGAVRSGKSTGAAEAMLRIAIENKIRGLGNGQYIVAGQTTSSFFRNCEKYLREFSHMAGLSFRSIGGSMQGYVIDGDMQFYLFGGNNKRSYLPVRGVTVHSAWIDEATLCDELFFETVLERCSFDTSKIILTSNSGRPTHWLKTNYLDTGMAHVATITSTFDENQHFSREAAQWMLSRPSHTANYRRAMLNEWVADDNLVIPIPAEAIDFSKDAPTHGNVYLDPGTAGVTAALLFTPIARKQWLVSGEYYHDGRERRRLTDDQHLDRVYSQWRPLQLAIDPAGASMRQAAIRKGYMPRRAKNERDAGIQTTNHVLQTGQLMVHHSLGNLFAEADSYVWNERGTQTIGADHLMDCLRYGAYGLFGKTPVEVLY